MPMPPMNLDEASKEENGEEEAKPSTQPSDPETPEEKKPEEPVSEEKREEIINEITAPTVHEEDIFQIIMLYVQIYQKIINIWLLEK